MGWNPMESHPSHPSHAILCPDIPFNVIPFNSMQLKKYPLQCLICASAHCTKQHES